MYRLLCVIHKSERRIGDVTATTRVETATPIPLSHQATKGTGHCCTGPAHCCTNGCLHTVVPSSVQRFDRVTASQQKQCECAVWAGPAAVPPPFASVCCYFCFALLFAVVCPRLSVGCCCSFFKPFSTDQRISVFSFILHYNMVTNHTFTLHSVCAVK